ncbi:MAG: T9SS type A sorting domain-containing protein [Candidatus Bipolaricaulota bacterium]|nr:MAG: T9SS type A sorting domain-containing protein [Candidatus Bipolaricaulota bacterium]
MMEVRANHSRGCAVAAAWRANGGNAHGFWGSVHGEPGHWITPSDAVRETLQRHFGFGDDGQICYAHTTTDTMQTIWLDGVQVYMPGTFCPSVPGGRWKEGSLPGIIPGTGVPVYRARLTGALGHPCGPQHYGLFTGFDATLIVLGHQTVPGVPDPLSCAWCVLQCGFSELGSHHLVYSYLFDLGTVMIMDGAGLELGGTLVMRGNIIPPSVGGDGTDKWGLIFDSPRVNEAGDFLFAAYVDPYPGGDQLFVYNGLIHYREGSWVDGEIVAGKILCGGGALNAGGDFALLWAYHEEPDPHPAVIVNDRIVATAGDPVDFDGDGVVDAGATLAPFFYSGLQTFMDRVALSDRDGAGNVTVYFLAEVDTAGTPTAYDDLECFLALEVEDLATAADVSTGGPAEVLAQNTPNPSTGRTEIRFALERHSPVRLTVYDVAGRRVATLLEESVPAGPHAVQWSGRNDRGETVPGGVYFYRLEAPGIVETRKLILLGAD